MPSTENFNLLETKLHSEAEIPTDCAQVTFAKSVAFDFSILLATSSLKNTQKTTANTITKPTINTVAISGEIPFFLYHIYFTHYLFFYKGCYFSFCVGLYL